MVEGDGGSSSTAVREPGRPAGDLLSSSIIFSPGIYRNPYVLQACFHCCEQTPQTRTAISVGVSQSQMHNPHVAMTSARWMQGRPSFPQLRSRRRSGAEWAYARRE